MRRAVELAARSARRTSPNPVVGAVVLDADGAVVGEGCHERRRRPARRGRGARRRPATGPAAAPCVVTLEPCAHTGRTGPCTDALLAAGVARVVYAVADPNPAAAGGADALRAAGVEVERRPARRRGRARPTSAG